MSIVIKFTEGPLAGETFTLEDETTIGRQADISTQDPKMSKIHALLRQEGALGWMIEDQESKNGLKINGDDTESKLLSAGDIIEIGTSKISIESVAVFWKPLLNQLLIESLDLVKNQEMTTRPFHNIPVLKFTQGMQYGESYILEYGPRQVGGESDDIQLFEPLTPDIAFEIKHTKSGAQFATQYPKIVQINDRPLKTRLLKKGDVIKIHNTLIEVDFLSL